MSLTQDDPNLLTRMRASYDSASAGQQKVLEFFLTKVLESSYLSAARIAELIEVSHSTVVRTAQTLGFEGFPEFQAALQRELPGRINSGEPTANLYQVSASKLISDLINQGNTSTDAILQSMMTADIRNIESLAAQVPITDVEQAVKWLIDAPHTYIIGLRHSAPTALSFAMSLRQLRPNVALLQPGVGDLVEQITSITSGDVLFAICFDRYMRDTLRVMDHARLVGARVVVATDTPVSPAARRADLVFTIRQGVMFYGASAGLFSLLKAIIATILIKENAAAQKRLANIDKIVDEFRMFVPGTE
jgi:DNA-binding MurR/RpiR family transcriptional regulator